MSPPLLRFAQDSSLVACGAPRVASLRCRQAKRSTIPPRTPANERSDVGAALAGRAGSATCSLLILFSWSKLEELDSWSHWSLWESNYTLSTFLRRKKFLKYVLYIFYCGLLFTRRCCFLISVVPKSGFVGDEERNKNKLMNSESDVRRKTHWCTLIVRQKTNKKPAVNTLIMMFSSFDVRDR